MNHKNKHKNTFAKMLKIYKIIHEVNPSLSVENIQYDTWKNIDLATTFSSRTELL